MSEEKKMACEHFVECKYGKTCTLNEKESLECPISKELSNKKIEKIPRDLLSSIGGKSWEKHGHKHVYFNHRAISKLTGLKCIVSFIIDGETKPGQELEIRKARELMEDVLSARIYYDLEDGTFSIDEKNFPEDALLVLKEKISKILGKTLIAPNKEKNS